jgi:methionyl aminopeptidase
MSAMFRRERPLARKTAEQIERMRSAGAVVGAALDAMVAAVAPGVTTRDLDAVAARVIREAGAKPSFLHYNGFPATICASVNDEIVHGIPTERALEPGDLVSLDCGAIVDGWHGDAAVTVTVGEPTPVDRELIEVTAESLRRGIAAFQDGARLTDIGYAIE